MLKERQALIVWLHNLRNVKLLRKYGNLHYASPKMKYAVIYVNMDEADDKMKTISNLGFVKTVERSLRNTLPIQFDNKEDFEKLDYRVIN